MAKIYGLFGSMNGKVANVVMSTRYGEQIVRKYQPIVFNPSTSKQVASRAKLKMLSQLSTILSPVIAIPREGSASPRNLFVKQNYAAASYNDSQADINLTSVKLTKSAVSLPTLGLTRSGSTINISLATTYEPNFDRVVYAVLSVRPGNELFLERTVVVSTPGENNTFATEVTVESAGYDVVVYAYGIRDNSDNARAVFGNLEAVTAEQIAKLVVNRTLTMVDVTLTTTNAAYIASGI